MNERLKDSIVTSVVLVGIRCLLFVFASSFVPAGLGMVADIVSFALIFVAIAARPATNRALTTALCHRPPWPRTAGLAPPLAATIGACRC